MALTLRRAPSAGRSRILSTLVLALALTLQPMYGLVAGQVANAMSVHTTDLAGWYLGETKTKGHNELVDGGLRVWTDASDSESKAAGYRATPGLKLSQVSSTAINFVSSEGGLPSVQLGVDKDGNGTWDGYLVYEPWAYGDGQYWTSKPGFGVPAGGGYASMGTLAQYQAANPDANITNIGYSLGSGVKGDAVISSIVIGDATYSFGLPPVDSSKPQVAHVSTDIVYNPTMATEFKATATDPEGVTKWFMQFHDENGNNLGIGSVPCSPQVQGPNASATCKIAADLNKFQEGKTYYAVAFAQDAAGNVGRTNPGRKIIIDRTAPALTITSPTENQKVNQIVVRGTFTDTLSGTNYAHVQLKDAAGNGLTVNTVGSTGGVYETTFDTVGLVNGRYTIDVWGTDVAGNVSAKITRGFMLDTTVPSVTFIDGGKTVYNPNKNTEFKATATDSEGIVSWYMQLHKADGTDLRIGSVPCAYGTGNTSVTCKIGSDDYMGKLVEGETYYAVMFAKDAAGNVGEARRQVVIDRTPPVVEVTTDAYNGVYNPSSANARISDEVGLGNFYIDLYNNKSVNGNNAIDWTAKTSVCRASFIGQTEGAKDCAIPQLEDGIYWLRAGGFDAEGNRAREVNVMFVVDSTSPEVSGIAVTPASPLSNQTVTFSGTVSGLGAGGSAQLHILGPVPGAPIVVNLSEGAWTHTLSTLQVGDYKYYIVATNGINGNITSNEATPGTVRVAQYLAQPPSPAAQNNTTTTTGGTSNDGEFPVTSQIFTSPILPGARSVFGDNQVAVNTADQGDDNRGTVLGEQDEEEGTRLSDTGVFGAADSKGFLEATWLRWLAIVAALVVGWLLLAAFIRRRRAEEEL